MFSFTCGLFSSSLFFGTISQCGMLVPVSRCFSFFHLPSAYIFLLCEFDLDYDLPVLKQISSNQKLIFWVQIYYLLPTETIETTTMRQNGYTFSIFLSVLNSSSLFSAFVAQRPPKMVRQTIPVNSSCRAAHAKTSRTHFSCTRGFSIVAWSGTVGSVGQF